jgi:oligoendopeptidase F
MTEHSQSGLPAKATEMLHWTWERFEPFCAELQRRTVLSASTERFLADWTSLHERIDEVGARLAIAKDVNTADKEAEKRYMRFMEEVFPKAMEAEQALKAKLLDSGQHPSGFDLPLRKIKAEADLFRQENLALKVEVARLSTEYGKVTGAQTVEWEGKETTLTGLRPVLLETDRQKRERAWRLIAARQLDDRAALNEIWQKLLKARVQMAANAGKKDFREFRWQEMLRFDYTPAHAAQFQSAIESAVAPAAARVYDRRRTQMGLDVLKPWDMGVDPQGRDPLRPFSDPAQFRSGTGSILERVDPKVGGYFRVMLAEKLLDLENRKDKAPGGYCASLETAKQPFIFMNAVGLHGDVMTLIHEGGHAVHSFESSRLPYSQQRMVGLEFAEVASMGMELLAEPYFEKAQGGFYSADEARRARTQNLEGIVLFWPYMAVVDAFQHWVYGNPDAAMEPANCDREWTELWKRFMPGADWTGFEDIVATGWQRKLHIFIEPFYYIEYGLAQMGACQVWANALKDQAGSVAAYLRALALGGTKSLPELYAAAGARFAFDAATLGSIVGLIEQRLSA